ncbi:MAG: N-acetylmuramoyl-L-alanine amidase, partial [Nitrospirae bacterium]|nr:N-acetylmuramoyl-L-alanine amidase [Nitrospirota bacterium]
LRFGHLQADVLRVVFDLETGSEFKVFALKEPSRLVADISRQRAVEKPFDKLTDKPAVPDASSDRRLPETLRKRIVIDAGHGGHDPGAVGPSGAYEKDVVLDIALRTRDVIKRRYPFYEVILTRDKDIFIPLEERAAIANKNRADLFVSIHANASPNRNAKGIETYLLNWTDDEESLKVAARENAISVKKMKQVQSELGLILASLERENKRDDSVKLAGYVQNSIMSRIQQIYPSARDLGVKQALFYVLLGAKMPSILAEVSFISNPSEEKLLSNNAYRLKLAESIAAGIRSYFLSIPAKKASLETGQM